MCRKTKLLLILIIGMIFLFTGLAMAQGPKKNMVYSEVSEDLVGKTLVFTGTALDAKSGAVLRVKNGTIYIKGMDSWSKGVVGKEIIMRGTLKQEQFIPASKTNKKTGLISQGTEKPQMDFVLYDADEI